MESNCRSTGVTFIGAALTILTLVTIAAQEVSAQNGAPAPTQNGAQAGAQPATQNNEPQNASPEVQQLKERLKQLEQTVQELKGQINTLEQAQRPVSGPAVATQDNTLKPAAQPAPGGNGGQTPGQENKKGENTFSVYGSAMLDMGYDFKSNDPNWFDVVRPAKLPAFKDEFAP